MKTSVAIKCSFRWGLLVAISLLAQHGLAQFVAYNDHVPTNAPQTSVNATTYVIPGVGATGTSSGPLKDITSGSPVNVTVTITETGTITGGAGAGVPAAGTPCYTIFNNFVFFGSATGSSAQIPTGTFVTYTFSNLTAGATYNFRGAHVRGGSASNYSNRWTRVELIGAASATPAHSSGIVTSLDEPADLTAYQVAAMFGQNNLATQGDVVGWDSIVPAAGFFQVVSTRYTGALPAPNSSTANTPPYGYAISGIRLEEVNATPTPVHITVQPTNQTIAQCKAVTFHVAATGSAPQYQWFKNNSPISGANSADYSISSVQPSDAGDYKVTVSNNLPSSETSGTAHLTVTAAPALAVVSTVATTNPTVFIVSLNQAIDGSANAFDPTPSFEFNISPTGGSGSDLSVASATANGTNLILTTDSPRTDGVNYDVIIHSDDPYGVKSTCNGSAVTGTFHASSAVFLLDNTASQLWRYNSTGNDPGPAWLNLGYDDTAWPQGAAPLDGKKVAPTRTTITNTTLRTVGLELTNSPAFNLTNDIPTYNFRTHFSLPFGVPARLQAVTFWDDGGAISFNGHPFDFRLRDAATNTFPTYSASQSPASDAIYEGPFDLPTSNLVAGDNLISIEIKQVNATSSDITMGLQLIGIYTTLAPRLSIAVPDAFGDTALTWSSGILQQAPAPNGPWTDVNGGTAASPYGLNPHSIGGRKFYRLR